MKQNILIIILILFYGNSYSHEKKIVEKKYKNVEVIIYSEDFTEIINSALIIAKNTATLSSELNCKKKIKLYFSEEHYKDDLVFSYSEKNILFFKFELGSFNISKCLDVINYSIKNEKNLSNDKNFFLNFYKSSNTTYYKKNYRPDEVQEMHKSSFFNYYYQNGKYHFYKLIDNQEIILASVDNIEDFFPLNANLVFIFTSKDSFIVINGTKNETIKIEGNESRFYSPFNIKLMNSNKVFIAFSPYSRNSNRVMVYLLDKNKLIQDIENCR